MTHILKVGSLYHPSRRQWPQGAQFLCRPAYQLLLCLPRPDAAEVTAVKTGDAKIGMLVCDSVIFVLYRFGDGIPWGDAPFSIHMMPAPRELPAELGETGKAVLQVILLDAATGIIAAMRGLTLSHEFSVALRDAIVAQASAPFDQARFDAETGAAYDRFGTSEQMAARALRTKGGA